MTANAPEGLPTRRSLRNAAVSPISVDAASSFDALVAPAAPVEAAAAPASLSNLQPSTTVAPAASAVAPAAVAPATRREARLAQAPASKITRRKPARSTAAAVVEAPQPQVPRPEVFSYADIDFPTYATPPARGRAAKRAAAAAASPAPVRPAARQAGGLRKRVTSTATILAVTGFFAAVCIPAYAFGPVDTTELATAADVAAAAKTDVSLSVTRDATELSVARDEFGATAVEDLANARSNALKIANFEAYDRSGARELGDDYPWFSELSNNQGGGLSPLNYYYRECVDFVAWRLNRDAGTTEAPYKWDWNSLTPGAGSAHAWKRQWLNHGWPTGNTPKVGAVAWFGYHVAYVKSVNTDGTVTLEEYNHQSDHLYGQRTIPAAEVTTYLYAPAG